MREAFRDAHPDTVLVAEHMSNAHMSEALRRGIVGVVLAACPECAPELSSRPIRRERIIVLVSKNHPAADAPEVELSELASSEFLCPPAHLAPRFNHTHDPTRSPPSKPANRGKALCRTRTDDPFLTITPQTISAYGRLSIYAANRHFLVLGAAGFEGSHAV
ncbi:MAG: hypothetical protein JO168_11985 [Solirubrobacterales bacterium]|nr:hypothetical protein [Solirubrobacterales bacterium]